MKKQILKFGFTLTLVLVYVIAFGQGGNNVPFGSSNGAIWLLDPAGSYTTGISGPQLHVDGDITFTSSQFNTHMIRFHSPNAEAGHSLYASSNRADLRFDGTTLKLIANSSTGVPANENGIAIDLSGFVGFGQNTPKARIHLTDPDSIDYGSYFNSNSDGPTMFINRTLTGLENDPYSLTTNYIGDLSSYGLVVSNSLGRVVSTNAGPKDQNIFGAYFTGRNGGARGYGNGSTTSDQVVGLTGFADNTKYMNLTSCGVSGAGYNAQTSYGLNGQGWTDSDNGTAYGVWGEAVTTGGNAQTYGIYGTYTSSGGGWAGFFNGDVYTTTAYYTSDRKLKENIKPIENGLSLIMKINPKQYNFIQNQEFATLNLPKGKKYGLIAQELETVLPELTKLTVSPDKLGKDGKIIAKGIEYKTIDYNSLIPILISGIQEQQQQIEFLKSELTAIKSSSTDRNTTNSKSEIGSKLFQNSPNPFNEKTYIRYSLNPKASIATIMIFDNNGVSVRNFQIDCHNLNGEILIDQNVLQPGMYIYALIVDNEIVDSKRMILSK